jgi:hypothetical protein
MWTSVFALNVYQLVVKGRYNFFSKNERAIVVICFAIPIPFALLPEIMNTYGKDGFGCAFTPDMTFAEEMWLSIILLALPLIITLGYNIIIYAWVANHLKNYSNVKRRYTIKALMNYPLILVLCWAIGLIYYITDSVFEYSDFMLFFLFAFTAKLQGFLNAWVYGFHKNVRSEIRKICGGMNTSDDSLDSLTTEGTILSTGEELIDVDDIN